MFDTTNQSACLTVAWPNLVKDLDIRISLFYFVVFLNLNHNKSTVFYRGFSQIIKLYQ